jgi:hypothetical protein
MAALKAKLPPAELKLTDDYELLRYFDVSANSHVLLLAAQCSAAARV